MLQKKRVRDEEGLLGDESVLQYQNRCLFSHLKKLKEDYANNSSKLECLKSHNTHLSKVFMEINCRLLNLSELASMIMSGFNPEINQIRADKNFVSWGLSLLDDLKKGFDNRDKLSEENASMLDNMRDNIENIITKLISGINELNSSSIDQSLGSKLFSIQNLLKDLKAKTLIKLDQTNFEEILKEKDEEIDKLKLENLSLNRKVACFPLVPYIKYSQEIEQDKIEHKCWCYICAKDLEDKAAVVSNNTPVQEPKQIVSQQMQSNINNNIQQNIQPVSNSNTPQQDNMQIPIGRCMGNCSQSNCMNSQFQPKVIILHNQSSSNIYPENYAKDSKALEELEMIKLKMTDLIQENEDIKKQKTFNEINILESKAFSNVIEQAESNANVLSQMKDLYFKLYKRYIEFIRDVDFEKRKYEEKEFRINEDHKKKYYDLKEENSKLKSDIRQLKFKLSEIEELKNDSLNFDSIYQLYEKEKKRVYNELSKLHALLIESREKQNSEVEKNISLMEENSHLKLEVENLKIKDNTTEEISKLSGEDAKMQKIREDEYKKSIRSKKEKIILLEKKVNKYKEDLTMEKDVNTTLLQEMEANEQGINEMNLQIKRLKDELVVENEKIAKLTQDKIKNQKNIEALINERDLMKDCIKEYKNQLNICKELEKINKEDYMKLKDINEHLEESLLENEQTLLSLNNQIDSLNKATQEAKSISIQQESLLNEYRAENTNMKVSVESLNAIVIGKKLLRAKEDETNKINTVEYEKVKAENEKLKQRLKCNICSINYKSVIIAKCYHTFCRDCLNKNLSSRQRICPYCREKFGDSDVKTFWLNY
jgi:hypothetical protein